MRKFSTVKFSAVISILIFFGLNIFQAPKTEAMEQLAAKSAQVANEKAKRCACFCLPKEAANDE